ncbi:undecaprenyl phosphate 4-deoxy-4-formamido-L-arabinose transferase [Caulifigura coniformis]|uniref:Undecaprenyl phosphate 4-deoxy-4-formamido-L-arabinose transferase n=1 Tax=Caulifigura coniformis TaxID=2527983 RepID=A0A517SIA0_9PLAN|nr:glycosyltransferase [Caulifigura coniformis]QDT55853.1 undecaprenyl phosphate 4-deoxy-4-formamido-L-arabinose transferase [Caulifigura coniformis]
MDVLVLIPLYNDWGSAAALLPALDASLARGGLSGEVAFIDDGSAMPRPAGFGTGPFQAISACTVVSLRMNLGHQRALAVGLAWAEARRSAPFVAVMDGDGEDAPDDLVRLLESSRSRTEPTMVFAGRAKRSEGRTFRVGYKLYRLIFRVLVGMNVNFGNFSVLPRRDLVRLVASADLWNHYAAAVVRSRIPYEVVPSIRGTRLDGQSKMNLLSLVMHGLSAVAVFSDRVGVRMLTLTALLAAAGVGVLGLVIWIRLFTDLAIEGWATNAAGLLVIALLLLTGLFFGFSLMILKGRENGGFLPLRDYGYYIAGEEVVTG